MVALAAAGSSPQISYDQNKNLIKPAFGCRLVEAGAGLTCSYMPLKALEPALNQFEPPLISREIINSNVSHR
jgi:hypothetical protein